MEASCRELRTECREFCISREQTQHIVIFIRRLVQRMSAREAAGFLQCSERVIAGIRSGDYEPGELLINTWRLRFGEQVERAIAGEDPKLCAKRVLAQKLLAEIRAGDGR